MTRPDRPSDSDRALSRLHIRPRSKPEPPSAAPSTHHRNRSGEKRQIVHVEDGSEVHNILQRIGLPNWVIFVLIGFTLGALALFIVIGTRSVADAVQIPTSTPQIFTYSVNDFITTTIALRPGDQALITASGTIRVGSNIGNIAPDGASTLSNTPFAILSNYNIYADLPHAALICRLQDDVDWQVCGGNHVIVAVRYAVLEFDINDAIKVDNTGAFAVQIRVN